jgi:hypothetical protein
MAKECEECGYYGGHEGSCSVAKAQTYTSTKLREKHDKRVKTVSRFNNELTGLGLDGLASLSVVGCDLCLTVNVKKKDLPDFKAMLFEFNKD